MSKTEFLDPLEAEKFKKQKCVQFCGTPCICDVMNTRQISTVDSFIHTAKTVCRNLMVDLRYFFCWKIFMVEGGCHIIHISELIPTFYPKKIGE